MSEYLPFSFTAVSLLMWVMLFLIYIEFMWILGRRLNNGSPVETE